MKFSKNQTQFIQRILDEWQQNGHLDWETKKRLLASIEPATPDYKIIGKYFLLILLGSFFGFLLNQIPLDTLKYFLNAIIEIPPVIKCLVLSFISLGFFRLGALSQQKNPAKIYVYETFFLMGVTTSGFAAFSFGGSIPLLPRYYSHLLLGMALIWGILGYFLCSPLTWLVALLSFNLFFGIETGHISSWTSHFLGMSFPLRFALFGLVNTLLFLFLPWKLERQIYQKTSLAVSITVLMVSLWLTSIFGNIGNFHEWEVVSQSELVIWPILLGVVSVASYYLGLRLQNILLKAWGLAFLFINLFTQYFSYLWPILPRFVFLLGLALGFLLTYRYAKNLGI